MKLLLIRHASAVPRGTAGIADPARPLTPEGEREFRDAARGIERLVRRPDALLTSPLPRARRTAELAAHAWGKVVPCDEPALASGEAGPLEAALAALPGDALAVFVGHEPHLSELLAKILGAPGPAAFRFGKGGAALVELPGPALREGTLVWFLPPKALRKLGRR